jgi:hypothetical protein
MTENISDVIVDWEWSGDAVTVVQTQDDPTIFGVVVCNPDGSNL